MNTINLRQDEGGESPRTSRSITQRTGDFRMRCATRSLGSRARIIVFRITRVTFYQPEARIRPSPLLSVLKGGHCDVRNTGPDS